MADLTPTAWLSEPHSEQGHIRKLPVELISEICVHLPNDSIKNLRLASSFFAAAAQLRIDRVFLSANPRNIQVFLEVASHEVYRKRVVEIIWDDALLAEDARNHGHICYPYTLALERIHRRANPNPNPGGLVVGDDAIQNQDQPQEGPIEEETPAWFAWFHHGNCRNQGIREIEDEIDITWRHYRTLLQQQRAVLDSNALQTALTTGLERFINVKRITFDSTVHGSYLHPSYETPMIRAFPPQFNYPVPYGWQSSKGEFPFPTEWRETGREWLGFRTAMPILATHRDGHRIKEIKFEPRFSETGLNGHVFDSVCPAYTDFAAVIAQPGFRVLDLVLQLDWENNPESLRSGLLKKALERAAGGKGLERLALKSHFDMDCLIHHTLGMTHEEMDACYVPLEVVFSTSSLAGVTHFSLGSFIVKDRNLIALLTKLPETLAIVELSTLSFVEGNYRSALIQMRNKLGWKKRSRRPQVRLGVPRLSEEAWGLVTWIDFEAEAFLYGAGENPFEEDDQVGSLKLRKGVGIVKYPCGEVKEIKEVDD